MITFFLIIIYLAFISLGLPDSLIGSAWPVMQYDLDAPFELAGILYMVVAAATIVSSLLSSKVISRFGTGKVTLISVMLTAFALLGISFAPSIVWIVVCAIPLGLGAGAVDAGLNSYVAAHYKAHHMSWLHCFWGVGATLGPIVMSQSMAVDSNWRNGYFTIAIIQFVLVIILFLTLPLWDKVSKRAKKTIQDDPNTVEESELENIRNEHLKPLKIKGVKYALATFLFYCGVEATVGLWGSSYLVNEKALSATSAAQWISIYYAGITIGRFITGFITFKVSNKVLIRSGQVIALLGAVLLLLPLPAVVSGLGLLIIGLGLAPIFPCMLHEAPIRFGKHHAQTIMGYQMAIAYTGSTCLPPLLGFLATRISIGVFPVYIVACAFAMLLCTERLNKMLVKGSQSSS